MIIFGSSMYGKVDRIEPLNCHVATRFGHLYLFPLVPLQSFIVPDDNANGLAGIPIPLSARSVLVAWLRAVLVLLGMSMTAAGTGLLLLEPHGAGWLAPAAIALCAWTMLVFTYRYRGISRASYQRACALGMMMSLSEDGQAAIENFYRQEGRGFPVQALRSRQPFISEGLEGRSFH